MGQVRLTPTMSIENSNQDREEATVSTLKLQVGDPEKTAAGNLSPRHVARIISSWRRKTPMLTREALAAKLGVSVSTIVRWERPSSNPRLSEICAMEQAKPGLIEHLFGGKLQVGRKPRKSPVADVAPRAEPKAPKTAKTRKSKKSAQEDVDREIITRLLQKFGMTALAAAGTPPGGDAA